MPPTSSATSQMPLTSFYSWPCSSHSPRHAATEHKCLLENCIHPHTVAKVEQVLHTQCSIDMVANSACIGWAVQVKKKTLPCTLICYNTRHIGLMRHCHHLHLGLICKLTQFSLVVGSGEALALTTHTNEVHHQPSTNRWMD